MPLASTSGLRDLDAGEVFLAPAQHEPGAMQKICVGRLPVVGFHADVIDVHAAFLDGTTGGALRFRQASADVKS